VRALRARQQRNFLASLAVSQGVPMLLGGDEIGRTQRGNNNAYCQDNELSWYDWQLDDERRALLEFTRRAFALRAHPNLRRRRWLTGAGDVAWLRPDGLEMMPADWSTPFARSLGVFLNGEAISGRDPEGRRVVDASLLVLLNAWWEPLEFVLPEGAWTLALDTADPAAAPAPAAGPVGIAGRSLVVLERA
jgi:glycogen operon protein